MYRGTEEQIMLKMDINQTQKDQLREDYASARYSVQFLIPREI